MLLRSSSPLSKFVLTLINDLNLVFDINDTSIAQRWANEIKQDYPLYETTRFKSWPNDGKDIEYYKANLTKQIEIVNNYSHMIDNTDIKSQTDLNYLHKFFEDLRGPVTIGTEFFNTAPKHVQAAIEMFNVLIHECEHVIRNSNYPELVVTYNDRPRYSLSENDYEHFTFKWEFGSVYINYCEVGKTLLDIFKDQDTHIGDANVRPLEFYSADFTIKFGPSTTDEIYNYRLEKFNEWYTNYPLKFNHLSLGMIPVATINLKDSGFAGIQQHDIVQIISNHLKVNKTCIN